MTTLVLGATGATGRNLVQQLLQVGQRVKVIVRPASNIPEAWQPNERLTIIKTNISETSTEEMAGYLQDCQAVASCLGHNLTLKGIYGKPRHLVADAIKLIVKAVEINAHEQLVKIVLMNTAGNRNRDLPEPVSIAQKLIVGMIRLLVPPHADNEQAADFLRLRVGQNHPSIEWVVVRPDSLIDEDVTSDYDAFPSATRSAIFDPGKTSRINVADFMTRLIRDDNLWKKWQGQMPVIYNHTGS